MSAWCLWGIIFSGNKGSMVLTCRDEEVKLIDTSPFRIKVSIPWFSIGGQVALGCKLSPSTLAQWDRNGICQLASSHSSGYSKR